LQDISGDRRTGGGNHKVTVRLQFSGDAGAAPDARKPGIAALSRRRGL
jgi:hypothetical protein